MTALSGQMDIEDLKAAVAYSRSLFARHISTSLCSPKKLSEP